ncbi:hypothetical protein [Aureispira sp. CCB-E]|uniref:hypothetical protein n=1 Tax=Aureispira sp. CCB-E TaxID=3051121 RepID=UPI0028687FCD|nr:hypothetical protein [Aureispira sp. CCB-E]WMX17596.1 hypothetical protein QP953_28345 [Aureispira sp. CCB-E]
MKYQFNLVLRKEHLKNIAVIKALSKKLGKPIKFIQSLSIGEKAPIIFDYKFNDYTELDEFCTLLENNGVTLDNVYLLEEKVGLNKDISMNNFKYIFENINDYYLVRKANGSFILYDHNKGYYHFDNHNVFIKLVENLINAGIRVEQSTQLK